MKKKNKATKIKEDIYKEESPEIENIVGFYQKLEQDMMQALNTKVWCSPSYKPTDREKPFIIGGFNLEVRK